MKYEKRYRFGIINVLNHGTSGTAWTCKLYICIKYLYDYINSINVRYFHSQFHTKIVGKSELNMYCGLLKIVTMNE